MIEANIPQDKRDATLYLKARKDALIELNEVFRVLGIETTAHITGTIYNEVEQINELLGENDE